jgi:transposase
MDLSWNAIDGIMQRAVERGLSCREARCESVSSVDETAFKKHHDDVTIVSDQDTATVLHVGSDHRRERSNRGMKA